MKRVLLILFTIVLMVIVVVLKNKSVISKGIVEYKLQGKSYKLLVADNQEEWEKGLMFRRSKDGVDGMMFLFPDYEARTFWNKNTFIDIKVYWIKDDEIVGESELSSIEKTRTVKTISSPQAVNKVIEIIR